MGIRLIIAVKGSSRSGNYGHAGRQGKVGGSAPKKGAGPEEAHPVQDEFTAIDNIINDPDILGKLKIPKVVYHITDAKNIPAIMQDGLRVNQQRASTEGSSRGVYLTDNVAELMKHQHDIKIGKRAVLEVSTEGLNLRLDPEFFTGNMDKPTKSDARDFVQYINDGEADFAMYSKFSIPPSHIKVIS